MNKKGDIQLVILVFVLVFSGSIILLRYANVERSNSSDMFKKYRSRYIAESVIDIQRHLLQNKLDNLTLSILYETDESRNSYLRNSSYLFDLGVLDNGFTDIDTEVMGLLSKTGDMYSVRGELEASLKLINPFTKEGLKIENLCSDPSFWIENLGDKKTYEDYVCKMNDLYFVSKVKYLGGELYSVFKVTDLKLMREPFGGGEGIDSTDAIILTDEMNVEIESFQFIRGEGIE